MARREQGPCQLSLECRRSVDAEEGQHQHRNSDHGDGELVHTPTVRVAMTLADNAITQSKLAEMVLDVETSALLVYRAAWLRDVKGQRNSREAALAKLHATDSAVEPASHIDNRNDCHTRLERSE